jgi:cobalt-zinc-cadmium efflux system outer membrane protein
MNNGRLYQPLEWPATKPPVVRGRCQACRRSVGLIENRFNLTSDVKVAFYDLLLAQRDLELTKNNLSIVEDVRRVVSHRVRLGEALNRSIKAKGSVESQSSRHPERKYGARQPGHSRYVDRRCPRPKLRGERFSGLPSSLTHPSDDASMHEHPSIQRLACRLIKPTTPLIERQSRVPTSA